MSDVTILGRLSKEPIPLIEANTTWFEAGVVTIGVENRTLAADAIERAYRESDVAPETRIQEVVANAKVREAKVAGKVDRGPAIHVIDTATRAEHFRIDAFRDAPHYHYLIPGVRNIRVLYDDFANGDVIGWGVERIRTRLPELLEAAGAPDLARQVDRAAVERVIPDVERLARGIAAAV